MNQFKGLTVLFLIIASMFSFSPAVLHAGTDVATEMALDEKDSGSDGELASVEPTEEDEQMIADSQHGR